MSSKAPALPQPMQLRRPANLTAARPPGCFAAAAGRIAPKTREFDRRAAPLAVSPPRQVGSRPPVNLEGVREQAHT
eukprot:CAMPEP_0204604612 /NCGR_PEP_ID=MMETSP0661-20131031/57980_1 /ASSEMBLY_ACC=CAM_ASM_000606 /TAXON_ID=109239 /ORGANISM="Alexandrium margalefi, Strain AMGDE01CS-322" /LENGTH=75 /DNA_ID=CAMNT_0051615789 /DNA_START=103 /DNA_END=327 /DNA_ORIENTATION=-